MNAQISTAMVLSAGFGSRMRPLTNTVPKPLIKLAGRPLLDHVLERLAEAGIERAVINVHYLADQIEQHLAHRDRPKVVFSDERAKLLETGGAIRKALPLLGADPFLVHNSDSVWHDGNRANLPALLQQWESATMSALLLLARRDTSIGYDGRGDFSLNADGRLKRRAYGQTTPFIFAGVSILAPQLFEGITEEAFSLNVIFDKAIAENRLFGIVIDGVWMHVGTPEALLEAESFLHDVDRQSAREFER